jgi:hypothetical protein
MSPRWGSTPRLTDWPTVSRNVSLTLTLTWVKFTRVVAGSNNSTVTLRVVGGDEKGSLKSEAVKYGHESQGTLTQEWLRWRGAAAYTKDRPVDTKTYWLTDSQSQRDFDFDFDLSSVQFLTRRVPDEEMWIKWQFYFNYEWIIVATEARELGLGAQKKTRSQPAKNWRVIRRPDLRVTFEDWECDNFCVESRC